MTIGLSKETLAKKFNDAYNKNASGIWGKADFMPALSAKIDDQFIKDSVTELAKQDIDRKAFLNAIITMIIANNEQIQKELKK